jgi:HAD superfamily hydrolase (TIGR01484 family)
MPNKIRLIVTDVDGCLTEERAAAYDLDLLAKIRALNHAATGANSPIPLLTLCTGRPQPYIEALLKLLDLNLPAICENGGMIYQLQGNHYYRMETVEADWEQRLANLRQRIRREILPLTPADLQPGKETHITLIAPNHAQIELATQLIQKRFAHELTDYTISLTENCLNIVPGVFDKGSGLLKLAALINIPLSQIAAVGDSDVDLAFMKLSGYAFCPQNASPLVKAASSYVARTAYTAGLIEIIELCQAINTGQVA